MNITELIFALETLRSQHGNVDILGFDTYEGEYVELYSTDLLPLKDKGGTFIGFKVDEPVNLGRMD